MLLKECHLIGDIEITCPSEWCGLSDDTVGWAKLFINFMLWSPEGIYGFLVRIACNRKVHCDITEALGLYTWDVLLMLHPSSLASGCKHSLLLIWRASIVLHRHLQAAYHNVQISCVFHPLGVRCCFLSQWICQSKCTQSNAYGMGSERNWQSLLDCPFDPLRQFRSPWGGGWQRPRRWGRCCALWCHGWDFPYPIKLQLQYLHPAVATLGKMVLNTESIVNFSTAITSPEFRMLSGFIQ